VTLVYEVPGITLTVRGKATEGGAEGDVISVLNEQSKRTVQGVVSGPGRVIISTGSPRFAANIPPARNASNADAR
jgi:flagella basal body P-ring formation protein FlgA